MKTLELLPPSETMYRALVNRDPSFEGIFYAGVRTTGIFCRPTCSAKKPARENVDFFATPSEALHGGYRPCLRCRELEPLLFLLSGSEVLQSINDGRRLDFALVQR